MSHQHYYGHRYQPYGAYPHHGLLGVFGGIINLTTATLGGSARIIRTIVEGTVWHGCQDHCGCGHHMPHHSYHVQCCPPTYPCCH